VSSIWDILNVISGQISNVETISSGVSEIKNEITPQVQLPSVSYSFGGSFAEGEISANIGGSSGGSAYGEIYDPAIDGFRPVTIDEAISSKNQSIANAPADAPQGYVDSLRSELDQLINDKIAQIVPSSGINFSDVSAMIPDIKIPVVDVPAIALPVVPQDTEIAESKMRPVEPQEPVKDLNPPTAVADSGETHSDFTPTEQPSEPAAGKGLIAEIVDRITARPQQPSSGQQGGVFGESGYVPYQIAEEQAPSPFPLLIGAGLLFMALEKKTRK